jgi:hypothetical protein
MADQGTEVPGSEGGGGIFSGSIWDDIWNGASDFFSRGVEAVEKWYELEFKKDLAELQYDQARAEALAAQQQAAANGTYAPGPFEDISPTTLMLIAGAAVVAVVLLRR